MNKQRTLGKRALSYILCMALVLSGLMVPTQQVRAEETPEVEIGAIVASGDSGVEGSETSVKWELTKNGTTVVDEVEKDTYTITIKGNGAMADYNTDEAYPEWSNTKEKRESITKVIIGYGVTRIGNDSFYGCSKVEEVVFERNENGESSVTAIGTCAFQNNTLSKELTIPASVNSIGDYSFKTCDMLTSVIFEEDSNLTTIGVQAFYGSKDLEECILPSKVTTIRKDAFRGVSSLKCFYYPSKVNEFGTEVFYSTDSLEYFGRYTINETAKTCSVEYIGLNQETYLPDDTIVPTATEIIIPEKLDGYEVVQATIGDKTVNIPKSFEADHKIAKLSDIKALEGWTYEAEKDELPAGGSVDVTATYNVSETQKLTKTITVSRAACVDANKDHKCDLGCDAVMGDCVDANKDHKCDYGCDKNIGECVDANKDHKCDYGCDKVTEHTWDEGVITKEPTPQDKGEKTYTCTFCKATKTEEVAALGVPEVGTEDVSDDGKATYKVTKSDLEKGTVIYVAPTDAKATTVTIPATVEIDGVEYSVTAIEKNAFKKNKNLKTVTIGKNVKTIGANAFYNCTKLKTVTFGSNVTSIGDKAFYKCTALTKISLPSKVKTIGKSAFEGCKKVTSVTIGKSVAKIGEKAFYGCSKVKTLTIKSTKLTTKKIGSKAFAKTPKSVTVKVPKKKFTAYKSMLIKKGVNKKAKFKKN